MVLIGQTHFQNDMICSDMKSGLLVTILTDHLVDDIREEIVASDILLRSKPRVAVRKISLSQLKNIYKNILSNLPCMKEEPKVRMAKLSAIFVTTLGGRLQPWRTMDGEQNSKKCLLDADLDKQSVISQVGNIVAWLPDVHFHSWKTPLNSNYVHTTIFTLLL